MKNSKITVMFMLFAATFTACKKSNKDIVNDDESSKITNQDLVASYIVATRKTKDHKLAIIYFTEEAGVLKANLHRKGSLRIMDVSINNSSIELDPGADGSIVYKFTFDKGATGQLTLTSSQLTDKTDANQGISYATLVSAAMAPDIDNSTYKSNASTIFKFNKVNNASNFEWDVRLRQTGTINVPPNPAIPIFGQAPEFTLPYYKLAKAGFKVNDEFIGTWVPNWEGLNTPVLLLERDNSIYTATKQ